MRSVLFPSLIVLTIGSFLEISSAPIPTEVIEGTKAETAEAPANDPTKETQDPKRTGKKLTSNGLFNSFLCGAGYNYNQNTNKCVHPQRKSIPGAGGGGNPSEGSPVETQTESSVEPMEYSKENVSKVNGGSYGFFPLECGMNYRYLKKAKICKAVTRPKSSESLENDKSVSSSEEADKT